MLPVFFTIHFCLFHSHQDLARRKAVHAADSHARQSRNESARSSGGSGVVGHLAVKMPRNRITIDVATRRHGYAALGSAEPCTHSGARTGTDKHTGRVVNGRFTNPRGWTATGIAGLT
jgi:hypothetical protein